MSPVTLPGFGYRKDAPLLRVLPNIALYLGAYIAPHDKQSSKNLMLYYTLIFLVVALIAAALGFVALAGLAASIAKILFIVFLVLFLVSLIRRKRL